MSLSTHGLKRYIVRLIGQLDNIGQILTRMIVLERIYTVWKFKENDFFNFDFFNVKFTRIMPGKD